MGQIERLIAGKPDLEFAGLLDGFDGDEAHWYMPRSTKKKTASLARTNQKALG